MEQLQKQRDQRAPSYSNSSGQAVQSATPKIEFQNMEYTIYQHMTKIFQFLQKRLGITESYSTLSMEPLTDKCVDMGYVHVYVDESNNSSWTELFGKPGDSQENEHRRD